MTNNFYHKIETIASKHPIVLFDGVCNFCDQTVQFVIDRDPKGIFYFASLQSDIGQHFIQKYGLEKDYLKTLVVIEEQQIYTKSNAALKIAKKLNGFWFLLGYLSFVPRPLRDGVYEWVSQHRYQWWGKKEHCVLPTADLRRRFLA